MSSETAQPQAEYQFSVDWFSKNVPIWRELFSKNPVQRYLEIGAFEGRSACFVIEHCGAQTDLELHCVDTWEGGIEHDPKAMPEVEARFEGNIAAARARVPHKVELVKHKALSSIALARLIAEGKTEHFDAIYIDGSHQAPDVLTDACLAFPLLKVGGIMMFDDYLWRGDAQFDFYNLPKPAVDAFLNIFQRKMVVFQAPLYQIYARKISR